MSGSHPTPVEQHLGDRLAALVDGELGHDARDRVLAHLATCPRCKAEADAQRRLKSVFAEAAPPPPSESFLARLQGLPGGSDSDRGPSGMSGGSGRHPHGGGLGASGGILDITAEHALTTVNPLAPIPGNPFRYAPSAPHAPVLPTDDHGFRIHHVGRHETERTASRSRRFAFAAAGAVSLAAIALGGVSAGVPAAAGAAGGGPPSNATPLRTSGPASAAEAVRRRGGPVVARSEDTRNALPEAAAPVAAEAPLLPGVPRPAHVPDSLTDSLPVTSSSVLPLAPLIHALPIATDLPGAGLVTDAG